jgi:hypothetical protein
MNPNETLEYSFEDAVKDPTLWVWAGYEQWLDELFEAAVNDPTLWEEYEQRLDKQANI